MVFHARQVTDVGGTVLTANQPSSVRRLHSAQKLDDHLSGRRSVAGTISSC